MVVKLVLLLLVLIRCSILSATAAATTASAVVVSGLAALTPTVCANSGAPVMLGEPLRFCGNTGISCCDAVDDNELREKLDAMNVPDATCAAIVKSFLCARCIPSLSSMFSSADPTTTTELLAPLLCASAQAQQQPVVSAGTTSMCLERVTAASFHAMTAHPDGSDRVFLTSRREGKVWLATMPERGARTAALRINGDGSARRPRPFLDLTNRVHHQHHDAGVLGGVMGVAFHPEFTTNGRFFVSYICDIRSVSPPACGGAGNGSRLNRYHLVVAEFSAQGGAATDFSKATQADPSEVRRIFTLGLPQPQYKLYSYQRHGGQILFRPGESDGYLYLITGYGYSSNTTHNNDDSSSGSFLGKILRFNVGNGPAGGREWTDKPEVFAAGLSNPSGCSFDSDRPWRLFCANVDSEQRSERVYRITSQMGGRKRSSLLSSVSIVVNRGRPADDGRMPTIVGGLVYRGSADTSLNGRYLYVYASRVWSGRDASAHQVVNLNCSWSSPVPCRSSVIGSRVLSMAEDNNKDAFFLTTAGVFRVVQSGACSAGPQPQLLADGVGWQLAVVATAMALAVFFCWKIFGGGGPLINNCFCCDSCCSGWSLFGNIFRQMSCAQEGHIALV